MMLVLCAPVVEEFMTQKRRKLKRDTHILEFIDWFCIQNMIAPAVHHRLGRHQADCEIIARVYMFHAARLWM